MKNLLVFAVLLISITACNRDSEDSMDLSDDVLIENLASSLDAQEVEPEALPNAIVEDVSDNFFETFIETVEEVPSEGYVIYLADGNVLYYTDLGRPLEYQGDPATSEVFRGVHPHGRCFRRLIRFGRRLPPAELSEDVTSYIASNYTDATIRGAKELGDTTLVLITGPLVLAFDAMDNFIGEWNPLEHCTDRCGAVRPETLMTIRQYINTNFPNVEIRTYCRRFTRIYVLVRRGDARAIMIFNVAGEFLGIRV
ncbi:MAG: hypothetical protein AAF433_19510 [Bacteroidota bacterium]